MLTVMLPMISNCRPVGPTNLHITSSTVAVCTWNRSWSLGKVDSITLISCFNTFRQAIVFRASTPRSVCAPGSMARTHTKVTLPTIYGFRWYAITAAAEHGTGQMRWWPSLPSGRHRTISECHARTTEIGFSTIFDSYTKTAVPNTESTQLV